MTFFRRLLPFLVLIASPVWADSVKPLVMKGGQIQQIPSADTLAVPAVSTAAVTATSLSTTTLSASGTATVNGVATFNNGVSLTAGATVTNSPVALVGASGSSTRNVNLMTGSNTLWQFGATNAAQSGSNAGANFAVSRYSDAGSLLSTPFQITRSTGLVGIESLTVSGNTALSSGGSVGATSGLSPGMFTVNGKSAAETTFTVNSYTAQQPAANRSIPSVHINALDSFDSFDDTEVHIGMVINGGKSTSTADTTGSYELLSVNYAGYGGSTDNAFLTAAHILVNPTKSSFNNKGQFTAVNPECFIPADMLPSACVAGEFDVKTLSPVSNIRMGVRIADSGSVDNTQGFITDAAMGILKNPGVQGFRNGILFGDEGQPLTFPIVSGGRMMGTTDYSGTLIAALDFSNLTSTTFSSAVINAPASKRFACLGVASLCAGGSIVSGTATGGIQLISRSGYWEFDGAAKLKPMTVSALTAAVTCGAGTEGTLAAVTDANSATFNATLAGGGSNHVMAYCNGTNWTIH